MRQIGEHTYLKVEQLAMVGVSRKTIYDGFLANSPRWQSMLDPENANYRLVRYETLADKYKERLRVALWGGMEPAEWLAIQAAVAPTGEIEGALLTACESGYRAWLRHYEATVAKMNLDERSLVRRQRCLARAAACLDELVRHYNQGVEVRDSGPVRAAAAWLAKKSTVQAYFPYKDIPRNAVVLKTLLRRVLVDGEAVQSVIGVDNLGNVCREQFQMDKELKAWLIQLLISGKNQPASEIHRQVQTLCGLYEKKEPSYTWVAQFCNDTKIKSLVADQRRGAGSNAAAIWKPYLQVGKPAHAGTVWQMDSTRVNFVSWKPPDGKRQGLTITAVRDLMSGAVLGVSFGLSEDSVMYVDAVRMAIKTTGYVPYELVYDRFPGHNKKGEMEGFFEQLQRAGVQKLSQTSAATGKAQLERWFQTFQTIFLAKCPLYYGEGIRSKRPYAHVSAEHFLRLEKQARDSGWNFEAAWQATWVAVEAYNHTPVGDYSKKYSHVGQSPTELHAASEKPHVRTLEIWEQATCFWPETTLLTTRAEVTITVRKQAFSYRVPRELRAQYEKLTLRYDEGDMSRVWAYIPNTQAFLQELLPVEVLQLDGPDTDWGVLARHKVEAKADRLANKAELEEMIEGQADVSVLLATAYASKSEAVSAEGRVLHETMLMRSPLTPRGGIIDAPAVRGKKTIPNPPLGVEGAVVFDAERHVWEQLMNGN